MLKASLKAASCFQIRTPPPAFTFVRALLTSVLELMIRNPCAFTELKDELHVSFEVHYFWGSGYYYSFILMWYPLDQLKSDSVVNYRLFRESKLKLWCLYVDSTPVQLPLCPTGDDELHHKMHHLGLIRKLLTAKLQHGATNKILMVQFLPRFNSVIFI